MKLWIIQKKEVWENLIKNGVYSATDSFIQEDFVLAYEYMLKQMRKRIGAASCQNCYLIWAWYQYMDENKKKPDLRYSGHLEKGAHGVLMELEIDSSEVLLSDFELWHYPLNYWYLPVSEEEGNRFDSKIESEGFDYYKEKPIRDKYYHNKIEESWDKIFDIDWFDEKFEISWRRKDKSIQATFWELKLEQVKNVRFFIAR
jgi:hypothetical protein